MVGVLRWLTAGIIANAELVEKNREPLSIHFDTSSSNGWIKYVPGLTLEAVFRQSLAVLGHDRLLFGSDSSFFPRGWVGGVYAEQQAVLDRVGAGEEVRARVFGGNFDRLFPPSSGVIPAVDTGVIPA